ncbi:hypothetical protein C0V97_07020 [Asaia sp. W19]|uniref:LysR family transcriptional regulator n=1 Tax=unclassified Asaia TaxID=2685023 RepID=UPI000F8DE501|nr:LysR family transcriptional regulator [Asaia sp. W19]RUT24171.1 hypothetical protein C0V97_18010 [Asaia sp. W19]RUT26288.1 hypothetical protein C0V97_07020 [Asaia sp. W19]
MDLRRLRMFMAVAEQGSITDAAKYLHMEQPPLSRQISSIEEELGVKLFTRSRRGTELTEIGGLFLQKVIPLVRERDNLFNYIKTLKRSHEGVIKIGFVAGVLAVGAIVSGIKRIKEMKSDIRFELICGTSEELTERLIGHDLDIVLLWGPISNKGLVSYDIYEEDMLAVIHLPKPHQSLPADIYKNLYTSDLIIFPREFSGGLYDSIIEHTVSAGTSPVIRPIAPDVTCIPPLVAAGLGNAIVPLSVTKTYSGDICYVPVPERLRCQIVAAARKEVPSQIVALFVTVLRR